MQAMGGLSGRRLAGYELRAFLGDDGFGSMYEAHHLNLGRTFTLRVLSDQFTFAYGFEPTFARMAQVLSALEHANLLTLDDFGVDGPYAYLVTPFIEGLTLDAWLGQRQGQPVNPALVIRLFGQMLAGLGHAHQAGVTHLGLAPRHMLVQPNGHLLIANFGLPYLAEQLWIAWNGTRTFGDPLYLAPEQMPGRTPNGVAADLYALGIILYRLLAGALPFEGPTPAILEAKQAGPPALHTVAPNAPMFLEAIVQRALAPAPADRWASVAEFGGVFYQALGQANPLPSSTLAPEVSKPLLLLPGGEDPPEGESGNSIVPAIAPPGGRKTSLPGNLPPPASSAQPPAAPFPSAEGGASVIAWSSAGRGRISPPAAPPGWDQQRAAPPRPRSRRRRMLSTLVRAALLLVTAAVLGFAIFYGYQRWVSIQHQMATPTVVPSRTPTPRHRTSISGERVNTRCVEWRV
ncbi:MAG TPA: protein kinase [Ktedonobacterales bacterium]|nr:protein kinase [Ktedonobacterales bacterium]